MEYANIHHMHPLQDHQHQLDAYSTLEYSPSFAAGSAAHAWTTNAILNTGAFSSYANTVLVNSTSARLQNDILVSSLSGCMTQDSGFNWLNGTANFTDQPSNDLQLLQIRGELSDSHSKFTEMISSPSPGIEDMQTPQPTCYTKNHDCDIDDMNVKLLLRTLSSGAQGRELQSRPEEFYCSSSNSSVAPSLNRGTFSHIYPTINVSNFNRSSLANSSGFDMNLQALDLFKSSRFSGKFSQSLQNQLYLTRIEPSYGSDYLKQSIRRPLHSSNITPLNNGVAEAKISATILEPKAPRTAAKRSRLESHPSCPPLKVRKEKLGDRIAALQQLVAPFGKTDTASVLMEAIGYIKFLQTQVQTLSVPYLKSSRNKTNKVVTKGGGTEESKADLKTRGLCLVPLSCLSYVADGGAGLWPPPNFGGGT